MTGYIPRFRPAGFATLPRGVGWQFVEAPHDLAHVRTDIPASRHRYGVIETDRPLTPAEVETFQLQVAEGAQ
jgi:hypothetical protein